MVSSRHPAEINFDVSKQCMAPYIESVTKFETLQTQTTHIYTVGEDIRSWANTALTICIIAALIFNPLSFGLFNVIGIGLSHMGLGTISLVCLAPYKVLLVLLGIAGLTLLMKKIFAHIYNKKLNAAEHELSAFKKSQTFEIEHNFRIALRLIEGNLKTISEFFAAAYPSEDVKNLQDYYLNKMDELQIKIEDQKKLLEDLLYNVTYVLVSFYSVLDEETLKDCYKKTIDQNITKLKNLQDIIQDKIHGIVLIQAEQLMKNAESGQIEEKNESKSL